MLVLVLILIKKTCSFCCFHSCETICLKCKKEVTNAHANVNSINDDFRIAFELLFFVINIKKKNCDVYKLCFLLKVL